MLPICGVYNILHMTYELALKLKNAGFPQGDKLFYWSGNTTPPTWWSIAALPKDYKNHEIVADPTLSEMMDWCYEIANQDSDIRPFFLKLVCDFNLHKFAVIKENQYWPSADWFLSPEEAVAWFALEIANIKHA